MMTKSIDDENIKKIIDLFLKINNVSFGFINKKNLISFKNKIFEKVVFKYYQIILLQVSDENVKNNKIKI